MRTNPKLNNFQRNALYSARARAQRMKRDSDKLLAHVESVRARQQSEASTPQRQVAPAAQALSSSVPSAPSVP